MQQEECCETTQPANRVLPRFRLAEFDEYLTNSRSFNKAKIERQKRDNSKEPARNQEDTAMRQKGTRVHTKLTRAFDCE